ncbi:hypothetical protein J7U46_20105 [Pelomonas sp. V22]|uniref:hypothetical protein n=1 Tax=Pelomonas sp. V22 TaxID=2822139 RepID=UPI0024A7B5CA|nr:hypothetical protein [Pelomonas sp. V22]MDI4635378.1 hypothetical protein [Pelomonas sp. V22]
MTEQIVAWHNRHPLAKRISAFDVHTVGVIALPFMRQNRRPPLPVEPVLSQEVDPLHDAETRDALAEGGEGEDEDGSNEPGAFSRFETESAPRKLRGPAWLQGLQNQWFKLHRQRWGNHWQWPVFSEDLIPSLSAARVARFALDYGYNEAPGDPHWPRRTAAVDEAYVAKGSAKHRGGAWPFELFLVSAGIDAGSSRTRVLIGQGMGRSLMLTGRRCISPVRSAVAALLLVGGLAYAGWSWLHPAGEAPVAAEVPAAPAPVPASAADSEPVAAPASAASTTAEAASQPASAAAEAAATSSPASAAAVQTTPASAVPASALPDQPSGPQPDIRPRLVQVNRAASAPPLRSSSEASAPAAPGKAAPVAESKADKGDKADKHDKGDKQEKSDKAEAKPDAKATERKVAPVVPPLSVKSVALVGPPSAKRADAEAYLVRMKDMLKGMTREPDALQLQVIETPAGFVPTVWPFATREQAQLINATMIARGLKTRAVDF